MRSNYSKEINKIFSDVRKIEYSDFTERFNDVEPTDSRGVNYHHLSKLLEMDPIHLEVLFDMLRNPEDEFMKDEIKNLFVSLRMVSQTFDKKIKESDQKTRSFEERRRHYFKIKHEFDERKKRFDEKKAADLIVAKEKALKTYFEIMQKVFKKEDIFDQYVIDALNKKFGEIKSLSDLIEICKNYKTETLFTMFYKVYEEADYQYFKKIDEENEQLYRDIEYSVINDHLYELMRDYPKHSLFVEDHIIYLDLGSRTVILRDLHEIIEEKYDLISRMNDKIKDL